MRVPIRHTTVARCFTVSLPCRDAKAGQARPMPRDAMALSAAIRPYCPPMLSMGRDILMTALTKNDPTLSYASENLEHDHAPPPHVMHTACIATCVTAACLQRPVNATGERRGESMNPLSTQHNFQSLSLRDLLEARDLYHWHLSNKPNVVGTAVGLYRIRNDEPW